ncbi:hypothetical protein M422DRAFT_177350, partial [Sphaerobolus stellatus SS14]
WYTLKHENLVPLLGLSTDFGRFPAIISSWMVNGLLTIYLQSEDDYDTMELILGVGKGVAYLHSQGIVHSDIRGRSVLVDELGNACLADPGLLNVFLNGPLTNTIKTHETDRWKAPELLGKSPTGTTFASDVYAFTMTSLEILTKKDPFSDVSDDDLVANLVLSEHRPARPVDADVALWDLWAEGWAQDPTRRPVMQSYVDRLTAM